METSALIFDKLFEIIADRLNKNILLPAMSG